MWKCIKWVRTLLKQTDASSAFDSFRDDYGASRALVLLSYLLTGGSVAEWLACWTQAREARVQIAAATLSGNSLRQTVHTHCASVHQAANLVAAVLSVARVTAGLVESSGSLAPGLWLTSHTGWLRRTGISSGTLRSAVEYGLPLPFTYWLTSAVSGALWYKERKCADTVGTVPVPWTGHFQRYNINIYVFK